MRRVASVVAVCCTYCGVLRLLRCVAPIAVCCTCEGGVNEVEAVVPVVRVLPGGARAGGGKGPEEMASAGHRACGGLLALPLQAEYSLPEQLQGELVNGTLYSALPLQAAPHLHG